MTDILVVGYGSPLRSDDAVGRIVAEEVESLGLGGVEVLVLTQLVPEVVEAMNGRDRVIFVDAAVEAHGVEVSLIQNRRSSTSSHHADPGALLALMADIGMAKPDAYLVSVPAVDLELGEGLSSVSQRAVPEAVDAIRRLVAGPTATPP